MSPVLLVRGELVHGVAHQDAVHGRDGQRQLVKARQIIGNPPRTEVIVLPEIENLADHLRRDPGRRAMRSRRARPQARLSGGVIAPFPPIEGLPGNPKMASRLGRYSAFRRTLLSTRACAMPTVVPARLL